MHLCTKNAIAVTDHCPLQNARTQQEDCDTLCAAERNSITPIGLSKTHQTTLCDYMRVEMTLLGRSKDGIAISRLIRLDSRQQEGQRHKNRSTFQQSQPGK